MDNDRIASILRRTAALREAAARGEPGSGTATTGTGTTTGSPSITANQTPTLITSQISNGTGTNSAAVSSNRISTTTTSSTTPDITANSINTTPTTSTSSLNRISTSTSSSTFRTNSTSISNNNYNNPNYRNANKRPYEITTSASIPKQPTTTTTTTSSSSSSSTSKPINPHNVSGIIVNGKRQKENPALKLIRGVGYHYDNIIPDFILGQNCCAIFLSIKYHNIHNEYIYKRIKQLNDAFEHRLLLVLVDVENPATALIQLDDLALRTGFQLILAWSFQEIAKYLALFKQQENATEQAISGQKRDTYREQLIEVMNRMSKTRINKTDAVTLVNNFGSLKNAVLNGGSSVELLHGWGSTKANNFRQAITEPFIHHQQYEMKPYREE